MMVSFPGFAQIVAAAADMEAAMERTRRVAAYSGDELARLRYSWPLGQPAIERNESRSAMHAAYHRRNR